jgi:YD repeat-containing protein
MTRPLHVAPLLAMLAIAGVAHAQEQPLPDAREFLNQSLARIRSNDLVRSRYTFTEKETRYTYDSSGRVVRKQTRIYKVLPSPEPELSYRRLVSVNGAAPGDLAKRDAEQTRKEQAWEASRKREGEDARAARLRKAADEDRREQAVVDELNAIYEMRMTGRETIDGRPAIVFTFDPKPGYVPVTPEGRIINHFRGHGWVDEQDRELVRLKVDTIETVSVKFGFIFRLLKGSRGFIERRKIDGESWLPTYSRFTGSGRVFFVARIDLDQESEYSAYKRKDDGR